MFRFKTILTVILLLAASVSFGQETAGLSDLDFIKHHIRVISADDFGGRKPLTEYETKTIEYIREQFISLGLQPGWQGGFFQPVSEIKTSSTLTNGRMIFKAGNRRISVAAPDEVVPWTLRNADRVEIKNAETVFAGYGITAPEYNWDDYAGADVNGKVVLVLEKDPFGENLTYYGRADYKFAEAFRHGAAGCMVIHIPSSSAYKFSAIQAAHGTQEISLLGADGNTGAMALNGWLAQEAAKRVFAAAGKDYDAALADAAEPGFRAIDLGVSLTARLEVETVTRESHNVIGILPGTDLKDECVVVTAHWDHLGIGTPVDGDSIYNGAGDNASGVAGMLAHIRRFINDGTHLRRSVVFVSVTSEEDGLLGSEWYCSHPAMPVEKTAAAVNIDGGAPLGKSKNIEVYAGGLSSVDSMVEALATAQGRRTDIIDPDKRGIFFRTDLFNFLRAGIPGVFVCGGQEYVDPEEHRSHVNPPYHHPKDEWSEDWDMSGVMDHWNLVHGLIELMANQTEMPVWNPGAGFSRK